MESIIKKLIDRLRVKSESAMPPEMDWESMRSGIYSKMGKEKKRPFIFWINDEKNKSGFRKFILTGVIIISGLVFLTTYFTPYFDNKNYAERYLNKNTGKEKDIILSDNNKNSLRLNKIKESKESKESKIEFTAQSNEKTQKSEQEFNGQKSGTKLSAVNASKADKQTILSKNVAPNNARRKPDDRKNVHQINAKENEIFSSGLNSLISENGDKKVNESGGTNEQTEEKKSPYKLNGNNVFINDGQKLSTFSLKDLNELDSRSAFIFTEINNVKINEINQVIKPENKKMKKPLAIGFYAGNSFVSAPKSPMYDLPDGVKVNEKIIAAPFAGIYVRKNLDKSFSVSAGVEWQQYFSKIEYNSDRMISQTIKDTVIIVIRNQITGREDLRIGDTTVNIRTKRNVIHLNSTATYNLPVMVDWKYKFGRFYLGAGGGMVLNLYSIHHGRTYDKNAEIEKINDVNKQFKTNLGFGLSGRLNLGYQLTNKCKLNFQLAGVKHLNNWRTDPKAVNYRPALLRTGLGLEYFF